MGCFSSEDQAKAFVLRLRHGTGGKYVCSVECAAMQLQLERHDVDTIVHTLSNALSHGTLQFAEIKRQWDPPFLGETEYVVCAVQCVNRTQYRGTAKCKVCGEAIARDAAEVKEIAAADAAHDAAQKASEKYVLIDVRFTRLSNVRVVSLTAEEWQILDAYSTPDLRSAYARDYGHPLAEEL
jgi:hypothetical protein